MDPADAPKSSSTAPVVVTFVINQLGDMKDIRVEHNRTSDLSKKMIVALYALPKFTPATKGGSNVGTSVKVTYTVSQFVMARSRHTAHRAKRIVSRAFTTSKSSPALGLS